MSKEFFGEIHKKKLEKIGFEELVKISKKPLPAVGSLNFFASPLQYQQIKIARELVKEKCAGGKVMQKRVYDWTPLKIKGQDIDYIQENFDIFKRYS